MPKKEVLEMCEKAIRNDLESLDDLPCELANTVANVYYQYFNHGSEMRQAANRPGWIPKEMKRDPDMRVGMASFIENSTRIMANFEAAQKYVEVLRGIDKRRQPNNYQAMVDFILDCLKYDIKDAEKKMGLRRMIERKFRKANVHEIPNLVDLLDI